MRYILALLLFASCKSNTTKPSIGDRVEFLGNPSTFIGELMEGSNYTFSNEESGPVFETSRYKTHWVSKSSGINRIEFFACNSSHQVSKIIELSTEKDYRSADKELISLGFAKYEDFMKNGDEDKQYIRKEDQVKVHLRKRADFYLIEIDAEDRVCK